jgi:hypothetical protein
MYRNAIKIGECAVADFKLNSSLILIFISLFVSHTV